MEDLDRALTDSLDLEDIPAPEVTHMYRHALNTWACAHTDAHSCTLTSTIYTVKHNDDKGDNDDADIQYKDYYAVCFWAGSDGRDGDKGHRGVPGPVGDNGTPGPSGPAPITDLYGLPGDPGKLGEHHRDSAINSIKPTMQYLCRLCKKLLLLLQ